MSTRSNNLVDGILQGIRRVTETNLNLHQQMLHGWSQFWPTFSRQHLRPPEAVHQIQRQWTSAVLDVARTQRNLLDQQIDAAIASFEIAMGLAGHGNGSPVAAKTPPARVESKSVTVPPAPVRVKQPGLPVGVSGNIYQKVAVVTGAASGIGAAVARELGDRGARAVLLVDLNDGVREVATSINDALGRTVAVPKVGDTTDATFRKRIFDDAADAHGLVTICVPAAGITRDALAVSIDKESGKAVTYPVETFRQVTEVNLLAPIYWGIEMVARIAEERRRRGLKRWEPEERIQGVVVFLGSVSSQGNKGQISYAVAKAGLEGAAATMQKEAIFHGVRCGIIHPGFTDTPMVHALGEDYLRKYVLPYTQLRRLIRPEEIADAICFMISNSAVSGELWADAGWHPPA